MSLRGLILLTLSHSFPRVSGDEPRSDHTDPGPSLFSPRERG